jgi:hypothetical protein
VAAIGHRLRDNARAASPPRHRRGLPLHCCADCASGNPARRPTGRRRRWRGRGAQRAASKHYAGWRAGCAERGPQAGVHCGSVGRLHVGTARRAVMPSTSAMVRPRARRRARCARWPAYQQRHRAAPTRPGWLIESNLRVDPRPCCCRAGIQGAAAPRLCCQLAANLGRCPSPRPAPR